MQTSKIAIVHYVSYHVEHETFSKCKAPFAFFAILLLFVTIPNHSKQNTLYCQCSFTARTEFGFGNFLRYN
jgi:hypothetical protein